MQLLILKNKKKMNDFITKKIETYIRYKKYNFYKIRRKLKSLGLFLDKHVLVKRIKQLK
jgi:hypothetical protein